MEVGNVSEAAVNYVIIGNGAAGNEAARYLRERDADSRITLVTAGRLLFLNRYEFPKVLDGVDDWREFLVHSPDYYDRQRITVRRLSPIDRVDPQHNVVELRHKEQVKYDKLLVASGGGGYLPEYLREYRHLLHDFNSIKNAQLTRSALPAQGGKVVMLGGDIKGLDLARKLVGAGHEVIVAASEHLFWPHPVSAEDIPPYVAALEKMGIQTIQDRKVARIEAGSKGMLARRVVFDDDSELNADVVMAYYGLMPALHFMLGSGVDIARGLLVDPQLKTGNEKIWAAGDVCQIWSPEENQYRFYYGWKKVKMMGRIAAINMTGGAETVSTFEEDRLSVNDKGEIDSTFWEYD